MLPRIETGSRFWKESGVVLQRPPQLIEAGRMHHHSSVKGLMEPEVHTVNEIRQVVDEVLLDGAVGRVHAQQVLVPGLGGLQAGVVELLPPFLVFLFDKSILSVFLAFLHRNCILQFGSLFLNMLESKEEN